MIKTMKIYQKWINLISSILVIIGCFYILNIIYIHLVLTIHFWYEWILLVILTDLIFMIIFMMLVTIRFTFKKRYDKSDW